MRIGARLRHAREEARLSLADVETRTGISKGFLSRVERDAASPSVANLVSLCDAIGLQMSDLFAIPRTTLVRHAARPAMDGLPKAKAVHDTLITPGVSSTRMSTPVARSIARMLRPSRPMMRPFISSDGILIERTVESATCSAANR